MAQFLTQWSCRYLNRTVSERVSYNFARLWPPSIFMAQINKCNLVQSMSQWKAFPSFVGLLLSNAAGQPLSLQCIMGLQCVVSSWIQLRTSEHISLSLYAHDRVLDHFMIASKIKFASIMLSLNVIFLALACHSAESDGIRLGVKSLARDRRLSIKMMTHLNSFPSEHHATPSKMVCYSINVMHYWKPL